MSEVLKYVECEDCTFKHPAGVSCCPECGSFSIVEKSSTGEGSIYTFTIPARSMIPKHKDRYPYAIAVVELKEGFRISTLVDKIDENTLKIGERVHFKEIEAGSGPIFTLVSSAA